LWRGSLSFRDQMLLLLFVMAFFLLGHASAVELKVVVVARAT
jgi:hypothetical protein